MQVNVLLNYLVPSFVKLKILIFSLCFFKCNEICLKQRGKTENSTYLSSFLFPLLWSPVSFLHFTIKYFEQSILVIFNSFHTFNPCSQNSTHFSEETAFLDRPAVGADLLRLLCYDICLTLGLPKACGAFDTLSFFLRTFSLGLCDGDLALSSYHNDWFLLCCILHWLMPHKAELDANVTQILTLSSFLPAFYLRALPLTWCQMSPLYKWLPNQHFPPKMNI